MMTSCESLSTCTFTCLKSKMETPENQCVKTFQHLDGYLETSQAF